MILADTVRDSHAWERAAIDAWKALGSAHVQGHSVQQMRALGAGDFAEAFAEQQKRAETAADAVERRIAKIGADESKGGHRRLREMRKASFVQAMHSSRAARLGLRVARLSRVAAVAADATAAFEARAKRRLHAPQPTAPAAASQVGS